MRRRFKCITHTTGRYLEELRGLLWVLSGGGRCAGGGGGTGNDGRQLAVEGCARRRTLVTFKDCVVAAFCVNTFGASFISQTIMLGQAEDLLSPIDDVYLVAWIRARISLAASTP